MGDNEGKTRPGCTEQSNEGQPSFLKSNWKKLIVYTLIAIGVFALIYLSFSGKGIIPVGENLSKEAWLSFLGTYLAFVGTVAVAVVASMQNRFYAEQERQRRLIERKKQIQPIFSIKIEAVNTQVEGTAEAIHPYKHPCFR